MKPRTTQPKPMPGMPGFTYTINIHRVSEAEWEARKQAIAKIAVKCLFERIRKENTPS